MRPSEDELSAIERFGVPGGGLHSTKPQYGTKRFFVEPVLSALRGIAIHQLPDLPVDIALIEDDKPRGAAQISIILGDLILQDEVISECVPGQLREQPVILVKVMLVMREYDVRVTVFLELLEKVLHISVLLRKVAIPEIANDDLF